MSMQGASEPATAIAEQQQANAVAAAVAQRMNDDSHDPAATMASLNQRYFQPSEILYRPVVVHGFVEGHEHCCLNGLQAEAIRYDTELRLFECRISHPQAPGEMASATKMLAATNIQVIHHCCEQCGKREDPGKILEASGRWKLLKCGKCKTAMYCGRDCQKAAWKTHKLRCKSPDAGTDAHAAVDDDADADSSDCDVRCPNFLVCGSMVPKWVLGCHGGTCMTCAIQRLGRLTFVDVDQHESCPICLEDGPAKHVKLDCNHTVCAACFSCPFERSPQPSLQEFGCPPYPQGTGPEDQDPTTGAYIWDGIEEAWRASNSSEAEAFENAVRCTYTVPNGRILF